MARKLLHDEMLLNNILNQTELSGVIGNDQAKKVILLACVSTLNENSDYTISVILQGPPGIGKTSIVKSILNLFPEDKVIQRSRMTPTALEHMDEGLERKVFFIEEWSGNQGRYNTKIAISEKKLTLTTVNSDKGSHKAETKSKNAVGTSFISTTTQEPSDKELESRIIRVYPEFSDEYISHVANSIIDDVINPVATNYDNLQDEDFRRVLGELNICNVAIPYGKIFLTDEIKQMENVFRNLKKILALIQAHTLLFQENRELINGVLIASENDYLSIKDLLEQITNPPLQYRAILKSAFGDNNFSVSQLEDIFSVRSSQAYLLKDKLIKDNIIRLSGHGRYELVPGIKLPDLEVTPAIPHFPGTIQCANEAQII